MFLQVYINSIGEYRAYCCCEILLCRHAYFDVKYYDTTYALHVTILIHLASRRHCALRCHKSHYCTFCGRAIERSKYFVTVVTEGASLLGAVTSVPILTIVMFCDQNYSPY